MHVSLDGIIKTTILLENMQKDLLWAIAYLKNYRLIEILNRIW